MTAASSSGRFDRGLGPVRLGRQSPQGRRALNTIQITEAPLANRLSYSLPPIWFQIA
jgi:hypothetical protein